MKSRVGQAKGLGFHASARGPASGHSGIAAPWGTGAGDCIVPLLVSSSQLASCFPEMSLSHISSVDGNARCSSSEQSPGQHLVSWPRSQVAKKQMAGPPPPGAVARCREARHQRSTPGPRQSPGPRARLCDHYHASTPWLSLALKGGRREIRVLQ